jgi:ABC-type multidrug transport system ATPase subunit
LSHVIQLRNVRFAYAGGPNAVDVQSLSIPPGLSLLLGPNGAGKSSLLRIVAGVERPAEGQISIGGHDLWSDEIAARKPLAYVPEQPELTPYATLEEIVRLVCHLRGVPDQQAAAALKRAGLESLGSRSVRQLSQGQRRRAVMAAAFVGQPSVLLLDEPFEAMDRGMREHLVDWIRDAVRQGHTVVVATHDFDELIELADRALAVEAGITTVHELPADTADREALLDRLARPPQARAEAD